MTVDITKTTKRFVIIGGCYFRAYTGTGTYTGLKVIGEADTKEEAESIYNEKYDDGGGLLIILENDINQDAIKCEPDQKDIHYASRVIQNEGLDYAVQHYCSPDSFKKDLRLKQLWGNADKALCELENYIETNLDEEYDD